LSLKTPRQSFSFSFLSSSRDPIFCIWADASPLPLLLSGKRHSGIDIFGDGGALEGVFFHRFRSCLFSWGCMSSGGYPRLASLILAGLLRCGLGRVGTVFSVTNRSSSMSFFFSFFRFPSMLDALMRLYLNLECCDITFVLFCFNESLCILLLISPSTAGSLFLQNVLFFAPI